MSRRLPLAAIVGCPLVALLIGGGAGWLLRDDSSGSTGTATPAATVVGATLPADLDAVAPQQPLPRPASPAVVDPATIVGLDTLPVGLLDVPPATAIDLPLVAGGSATFVDPATRAQLTEPTPTPTVAPAEPVAIDGLTALPPAQSTLPPSEDAIPTTTAAAATPAFVDPCTTSTTECPGAAATVRDALPTDTGRQLDPLQVSVPVAGAEGYAGLCDAVEGGDVPDPLLSPATRPTVAVLVNQPATLALTGTWADGTALEKTTMVTLPAHDAEWQRAWDQDRVQRRIIACVTLPLDDVRAHAGGGSAQLRADVLAISATGRADITGEVTLHIPIDGDDPVFAERLTVADRGEQRLVDGLLHPAVHVHYALFSDALVPAGSGLDPAALHVYDEHAFVEGADCAGWAVNQQGRDRSSGSAYTVVSEQRTIAGRVRTVTVVDGDVFLDPSLTPGWEGYFCVRLSATDEPDDPSTELVTLALRGSTVRSTRAATYDVSVLLDDNASATVGIEWATTSGTPLCTPTTLSTDADGSRGATCTTSARLAPDGIRVALTSEADGADGIGEPLLTALVPVNTAFCNPDDPYAAIADGCATGFAQTLELPLAGGTVRLALQVRRTAAPGSLLQDPSHAWRLGSLTSFAF